MAGRVAFLKESSLGRRGGFGLLGAMQWYYAVGSERRGPVETATFNRLVASGTIQPDTLVWRTGMAEWQAWSEVAPLVADVVDAVDVTPEEPQAETPRPKQTPDENLDDDLPMEALWERIRARGYHTEVGGCLSRGLAVMKLNYMEAVGTALLFAVLIVLSQSLPVMKWIAGIILVPQLTAGIWWYFLRRIRGLNAEVGNLFAGFKDNFTQLALLGLIQSVLLLPLNMMTNAIESGPMAQDPRIAMAMFGYMLVMLYVMIRWQFANIIVMDRGYGAVEALKLSWRIVGLRFWTLLGLTLILSCVMLLGMLALIIGLIFVLPLMFATLTRPYEDAMHPSE